MKGNRIPTAAIVLVLFVGVVSAQITATISGVQ